MEWRERIGGPGRPRGANAHRNEGRRSLFVSISLASGSVCESMRVVILGSGGGSNAKAILQAQRDGGGSADSGCAPFANRYTLT